MEIEEKKELLSIEQWIPFREIQFKHNGQDLLLVYYRSMDASKLTYEKRLRKEDSKVIEVPSYPIDEVDALLLLLVRKLDKDATLRPMLLKTESDQTMFKAKYHGFPLATLNITITPSTSRIHQEDLIRQEGRQFPRYSRSYRLHCLSSNLDLKYPILIESTYSLNRADEFSGIMESLDKSVKFL